MGHKKFALDQQPKKFKRLKKKPRGRPFEKGNKIGHRFAPGNRANPGGRPSFAKISDALRALLAAKVTDEFDIQTNAEAIALKIFVMGKKGNIVAIRETADRAEGRPNVSISVDGGMNPATAMVEAMNKLWQQRQRLLSEGTDEDRQEYETGTEEDALTAD